MQAKAAEGKETKAAQAARDVGGWVTDSNEEDSEYLRVSVFDPSAPVPAHVRISVNNTFLTKKKRASGCIDSGSMVGLTGHHEHVLEMLGTEAMVTGAHCAAQPAQAARLGMLTVTSDGTPLLFEVPGRSYYMEGVNDTILALAPIKKAGHKVKLLTGTAKNAQDGGYIQLTSGERINLVFENDLWRMPLFINLKKTCSQRATTPTPMSL